MSHWRHLRSAFVLSMAYGLSLSHAVANEVALLDLSLQELMNIKVVTASKRPEYQSTAPAVMQVISRAEIQGFGARNLVDVLDRATNLHVVGSNLYPHNRVSLRGVMQTHVDNKVLFLINGRPIREALQGGKNMDLYMGLPLSSIERIEIIRGPGSVIYGTNAFSGVINVVTLKDKTLNEANLSAGSFGHQQLEAISVTGSKEEQHQVLVALNHVSKTGDEYPNITDENGATDTLTSSSSTSQGLSSIQYGNWDITIYGSDNSTDHTNSVFTFPNNEYQVRRQFIDVGYGDDLNNRWSYQVNFAYHEQDDEFFIINQTIGGANTNSQLAEFSSQYHGEQFNLLIGGLHEEIGAKLNRSGNFYDTFNSAVYIQWDQTFFDSLKLIAGVQANKPEKDQWDLSPRLGMIYGLSDNSGIKLLYGKAYRSPYILDLFVDSPALQGNPDLEPEHIQTVDLEYFQNRSAYTFSAVLYYSEQKDIHSRYNIGGFTNSFRNQGEVTYRGIEISSAYQIHQKHRLMLNTSYQENETDEGEQDTTYSPNEMIKLGLMSQLSPTVSSGVYANYFGEPTQLSDMNDSTQNVNPKATDYTLITLNMNYQAWRPTSTYWLKQLDMGVFIDNLLDEDIYFPSYNRQDVNTLPHHSGRSITFTLKAQL